MTEIELNNEIQDAAERIQTRQGEISVDIDDLESKIKQYTCWTWGFVWAGIIVSILSILYFLYKNDDDGFALNLLGDFLGGSVASLWALAGLFLIYVAFLGQKQQLLNQQLELMYNQLEVKYTRLELAGQKAELKIQNNTLRQQKFENTFFQLITLFHSIVDSLDLRKKGSLDIVSTGRDCFEIFFKRLKTHTITKNKNVHNINRTPIENAIAAYDILYDADKSDMSHYFRTIYHIFKFIDNSDIKNKKQYTSIARAQLSSYEQIILFYNCLHENGREKFKPLIEKYSIFKNIDSSLLISQDHLSEYNGSAYGL